MAPGVPGRPLLRHEARLQADPLKVYELFV